jgi:hypothetical protein
MMRAEAACGVPLTLRLALALAVALGLALVTGCGGSASDDPAAPDGAAPSSDDGAAPADDAGPDHAPPAPGDAGSDAAKDAGPDGAADAGPAFCSTLVPKPKFCDDFDDGDLTDDWDQEVTLPGVSAIALDAADHTSGTGSLRGLVNAVPNGEGGFASLRTTVPGTPTHLVFSYAVRPKQTAIATGAVSIGGIDLTLDRVLTLYLRDEDPAGAKPSVKEISGGSLVYHPIPKVPAADVWTRITFDVDAAAGTLTLLYDAETILDAVAIAPGPIEDPTPRIGATYVFGPTDPFEIHVDDVVLDFP